MRQGVQRRLNLFPEREIPAGGVREETGIPGPAAPGDGDTGVGEG